MDEAHRAETRVCLRNPCDRRILRERLRGLRFRYSNGSKASAGIFRESEERSGRGGSEDLE